MVGVRLTGSTVIQREHANIKQLLQVEPYRACQQAAKGLDSSLMGNVAVILLSDVQPYMSGSVSYDNQVSHSEHTSDRICIRGTLGITS